MTMDHALRILEILDRCADACHFPMLDNGYYYLAASRLSLYRSERDWALAIELFAFSPRAGTPDVSVTTCSSRLHERDPPERYVTAAAYENYLAVHPHDDSRYFFPFDGEWQDPDCEEFVDRGADHVLLRGERVVLPPRAAYHEHGIDLADPDRVHVHELCRYLAATHRDAVLATESERRCSVLPEMRRLLVLDEWHHPDVVTGAKPSQSTTFRLLAEVLESGDAGRYRPALAPNNHWRNWPEGGKL
jgi:hypothetical protein